MITLEIKESVYKHVYVLCVLNVHILAKMKLNLIKKLNEFMYALNINLCLRIEEKKKGFSA